MSECIAVLQQVLKIHY